MSGKPDYDVCAQIPRDRREPVSHRIGAAWNSQSREDGSYYISVRINSVPLNWDGRLVLFPAKEDDQPFEA
jgi:uncharacterized protein (DUF736 family)